MRPEVLPRRLGLLAGAGLLAVVATGSWWAAASAPRPGGPLQEDGLSPAAIGYAVDAERPFSFSAVLLLNRGGRAAVLDEVRLDGLEGELRLVSAAVLAVADSGTVVTDDAFPPRGVPAARLQKLRGYGITGGGSGPRDRVQLLLELVATGDGGSFDTVRVGYHVGGDRYEAVYPFSLRACVPAGTSCDPAPP